MLSYRLADQARNTIWVWTNATHAKPGVHRDILTLQNLVPERKLCRKSRTNLRVQVQYFDKCVWSPGTHAAQWDRALVPPRTA